MRFRIATLLYVIALIAVSIATCGPRGILAAAMVFGGWVLVLWSTPPKSVGIVPKVLGVFLLVAGALVVKLLPAIDSARSSAGSGYCLYQIQQVALAVLAFDAANGGPPSPIVRSGSGEELHSWRTLLLPHVGQNSLYQRIDLTKAWNAPANRAATSLPVEEYRCSAAKPGSSTTSYHAIVDDRTVWSAKKTSLASIPDGAANTIMLIEADLGAEWAEPRDLSFVEAVDLLTGAIEWRSHSSHTWDHSLFYHPAPVLHVVFADGHISTIRGTLSRETAEALLTCNGGETIGFDFQENAVEPQLDHGRIAVFTAFCLLSLAPARWAFSRRVEGEA
ncbi:hypothetical protein Pla175_06620 [Pirellulimonas nuda]|uniref:DUF1559 domain-containing protein n=1 Tax=Pirellulimonas nuda TaxID=2528009 RepID=A0A518D738_9BACT|nr:DUF1559 domain-containing protein [Pirellulimonas nuda]QDU87303.1 hypothetical protein Pla175_06620 [Pirellulimonas nuda]